MSKINIENNNHEKACNIYTSPEQIESDIQAVTNVCESVMRTWEDFSEGSAYKNVRYVNEILERIKQHPEDKIKVALLYKSLGGILDHTSTYALSRNDASNTITYVFADLEICSSIAQWKDFVVDPLINKISRRLEAFSKTYDNIIRDYNTNVVEYNVAASDLNEHQKANRTPEQKTLTTMINKLEKIIACNMYMCEEEYNKYQSTLHRLQTLKYLSLEYNQCLDEDIKFCLGLLEQHPYIVNSN